MSLSKNAALSKAIVKFGEKSSPDLTIRQLLILLTIDAAGDAGTDAATLGDKTGSSAAAVSRNVRVFGPVHYDKVHAGLGWVEFALDPFDNRRRIIKTTAEGRAAVRELLAEIHKGS